MTGDDLRDFVNLNLFPHLAGFKQSAENVKTIESKIGEIFSELRNKLGDGYGLRDLIDKVDELKFLSNEDKYELSSLYEDKIKNMGNAGNVAFRNPKGSGAQSHVLVRRAVVSQAENYRVFK